MLPFPTVSEMRMNHRHDALRTPRWKPMEYEEIGRLMRMLLRGRHLSYQRSRHTTHAKTSLIKIEGVDDTNAAKYVAQ
jgi:hypothetical protein